MPGGLIGIVATNNPTAWHYRAVLLKFGQLTVESLHLFRYMSDLLGAIEPLHMDMAFIRDLYASSHSSPGFPPTECDVSPGLPPTECDVDEAGSDWGDHNFDLPHVEVLLMASARSHLLQRRSSRNISGT